MIVVHILDGRIYVRTDAREEMRRIERDEFLKLIEAA
jgi:hypothetical protein